MSSLWFWSYQNEAEHTKQSVLEQYSLLLLVKMGCKVPCLSSFAFKSNVNEVVITKNTMHIQHSQFLTCFFVVVQKGKSLHRDDESTDRPRLAAPTQHLQVSRISFFFLLISFLISALLKKHFLSRVAQHISSLLYESLYDGILIWQILLTSFKTLCEIHWLKKSSWGTNLENYEISSWFRKCSRIEGKDGVIIWRGKIQF